MPVVDIINIRAVLGIEILREHIGKPLAGFDVRLVTISPMIQPFQSQKLSCRRCVLVEREIWVRREEPRHMRLVGHRAVALPNETMVRETRSKDTTRMLSGKHVNGRI